MFVINKKDSSIHYFGGSRILNIGGYMEVSDEELKDEGLLGTRRVGWVEFSETRPETSEQGIPSSITFEIEPDTSGSTVYPGNDPEPEQKAEQEAIVDVVEAPAPAPVVKAPKAKKAAVVIEEVSSPAEPEVQV
jgi:hypothetical protein